MILVQIPTNMLRYIMHVFQFIHQILVFLLQLDGYHHGSWKEMPGIYGQVVEEVKIVIAFPSMEGSILIM